MHDLKYAFRQLGKSPGFTAVAVLTLALSIGACTAIFSVVNAVLVRPLAYPESERLVSVLETQLPRFPLFPVALGTYFEWKKQTTVFADLAAARGATFTLTGSGDPARIRAQRVSSNYLALLGFSPASGRDFRPEENTPGRENVVILTHGFWLRRFGGQAAILNQTIQLNGAAFTVIGIMPEGFQRGDPTDLFTPDAYSAKARLNHAGDRVGVIGRLKRSATLDEARAEMTLIADRIARQFPEAKTGYGVALTPFKEMVVRDARPWLLALLGAAGFLLLIGCVTVANLQLARATTRQKEIALHITLGASRGRIVRQLLCESLLLSILGGVLGIFFAAWELDLLFTFTSSPTMAMNEGLPRMREISIDGSSLGFTCVLALLAGLGFGLAPAWQGSRLNLNEALKEGRPGGSESNRGQRLRGGLIVAEVALALILLVGAGLLLRSFALLQRVDSGFQREDALMAELVLPRKKYPTDPQVVAFANQLLARLSRLRSVQAVGAVHALPFSRNHDVRRLELAGQPPVTSDELLPRMSYYSATPGYFAAMGIPLLRGRGFTEHDTPDAPRVAVINEIMRKNYFPDKNPIGQRVRLGPDVWCEIVGVVGDVKHQSLAGATPLQVYGAFAQHPFVFISVVLRAADPAPELPAAIRRAVSSLDPAQPIERIAPLGELITDSIARQRFTSVLFAVFSGMALLIAALGIYGVMAYSVARRASEIGIRLALGAQRRDVLKLVLFHSGRLVLVGVIVGLAGALALTHVMQSMLFGIGPHDPLTFATLAFLLGAIAILACLIPALRATKVDPLAAIRAE